MSDFKWFKDTATGKVGKYPAHFAGKANLVEVDSNAAPIKEPKATQKKTAKKEVEDLPVEVEDRPTPKIHKERSEKNG